MYVCTSCRFSFCDWCFLSHLIDLFSLKLLSGESCLAMLLHVKKKCALRELVTGFWRPVNRTGSSQDTGIRELKRKSVVWSVRVCLLCEVWDQSWQIIINELESRILWLTRTSQLTVRLFRFMESLVSILANARYPFPRDAYVWHSAWEQSNPDTCHSSQQIRGTRPASLLVVLRSIWGSLSSKAYAFAKQAWDNTGNHLELTVRTRLYTVRNRKFSCVRQVWKSTV